MKYEIDRIEPREKRFDPFTITLTFETRKEYVAFHNKAMFTITKVDSHIFHSDVYKIGNGEKDHAKGFI